MPIYGLKFRLLGQTSYYHGPEGLRCGDSVLIEAEQGQCLAEVVSGPLTALPGSSSEDLPSILCKAGPDALKVGEENSRLAREALLFCRQCIRNRRLDMKLVDVEVFFDRSKFIFYFTAPARIDFRDLVKDLVREYRSRIELRQIGVRHETQMVGAVGNCGMVCCCRRYLRKFAPVTIRMAKEQNLFLNPAKISGICGRLLCCLSYEQENYEQFHRSCPRLGKKYQTSRGSMKVLRANMFRNTLTVLNENNEELELPLEEWESLMPRRPDGQQYGQQGTSPRAVHNDGLLLVSVSPEVAEDPTLLDTLLPEEEELEYPTHTHPAKAEAASARRKGRRKPYNPNHA